MPQAKDRKRYPDVQEYLSRAIESERGIRIEVPDKGTGHSLMMKCHAKKKDWRKTYLEMSQENPDENFIISDPHQYIQPDLVFDPHDGKWYVYLRKDNPYATGIVLDIQDL